MRRWCRVLLAALALAPLSLALARPASAASAWTTLLRPLSFTDLLVEGDTLWCTSLEGGLLRYSLSTGRFETTVREPGGVVSNHLTALALDRLARLYIGTQGSGLNLLASDRKTFSVVNVFDGLPSDTVNVLEIDGDTVWVGTPRGIALWNGREIAGRLPDGINTSPFASNDVRGIARLGGDLWVATMDGVYHSSIASGLASWVADTSGLPRTSALRRANPVEGLATDGTTLIAIDSTVTYQWNASAARWQQHLFVLDGRRVGAVTGIWDDQGVITGASDVGVLRWNGTRWVNVNDVIRSVGQRKNNVVATVRPDGRMAAATAKRFCLEDAIGGTWSCTYPPGPPGNNVQDLVLDGTRLYVTSDEDGIGRFDGQSWRYWFPGSGFNPTDTTFRAAAYAYGLLADKQSRKFVGCWNSGFEMWVDSAEPATFTHIVRPALDGCRDPEAAHTFTACSALDSSGGHWFGLDSPCEESIPARGLDYYDITGTAATNYRSQVRSGVVRALTVSGSGRVWVGYAGAGLDYFDLPAVPGGALSPHLVPGSGSFFVVGLSARGADVWALTSGDLRRYREDGSANGIYDTPGSASDRAHHPIDIGLDGSVWVGTSRGVRRYWTNGDTANYNVTNSPLADDDVHTIRVDPMTGMVWLATAGGLSRLDPNYVAPEPPVLDRLVVRVFPNPARLTGLGVRLRLQGDGTAYRGKVIDLTGRRVRDFSVRSNGAVIWDGRDDDGTLVHPGIYFVHVEAGGRRAVVRVAVVR